MELVEATISMLDYTLNTHKKRHIAGGMLLSLSLMFGGLAATILTIKDEQENYNE